MLSWPNIDYRVGITLFLSLCFGFILTVAMPVFMEKPLLVLALIPASLFFVFLALQPKWTLAAVLLIRPLLDNVLNLTRADAAAGDVGAGAVLNLLVLAMAVVFAFSSGGFPRNRAVKGWYIFLFFMFVAILYSPFAARAVRLYVNYLSYFAMFIIPFLIIRDKKDLVFWLKVLAFSFVLPVLFADVDFINGGHNFEDAGMRIMGSFTHPNILAFYLVLGITFYFYLMRTTHINLNRGFLWAMVLNMLFLLVATKTRNAWIATAVVFLVYGLFQDRKVFFSVLLLVPLVLMVPQIRQRLDTAAKSQEMQDYRGLNSWEWRMRVWQSSVPLIKHRPLQGYGLTSFQPLSSGFSRVGRNIEAHNAYLEVLFETGIFGLLSFIGLFLAPLFMFTKNMKQWAIPAAYLVSYMIVCTADNIMYYLAFNWCVWFFIGLTLASERISYD